MPRQAASRIARRSVLSAMVAIGAAAAAAPIAEGASALCGSKAGSRSAGYRHVVVIMAENKSYTDIIGPRGSAARRHAPFLNHLARACGLATNYRGITHPSHPNYMAVTGGIPAIASSNGPNIFRQLRRSGETWRSYNPSMPRPCHRSAAYPYKPGHNPGIAWRRVSKDCRRWDVNGHALAADVAHHAMPAYGFITPDQCHNMHASCNPHKGATRAGDDWLRNWITRLTRLPSYTAGRTVIFITWDEGSGGQSANKRGEHCLAPINRGDQSCHVATFVLSAHVRPGTRSHHFFSHYSLLHTAERLLGYHRYIGHADDPLTIGMGPAFGL